MVTSTYIAARFPVETKGRFVAAARRQGISESMLLKRLVNAALMTAEPGNPPEPAMVEPVAASGKISVRLRSDDLLLLRERAQKREMPTATYVSVLIRSHLRRLPPLPTEELMALKRSIAEVGAVGRNLNVIAHALNRSEQSEGPSKADLRAVLRALEGIRDHTKAVLRVNLHSWEVGYVKEGH
jgi:hypothetical protein